MTQQQPQFLFEATDNYLQSLISFLQEQKERLAQRITSDSDYEKIIAEANSSVIQNIDRAINSITKLRQKLNDVATEKENQALRQQPTR